MKFLRDFEGKFIFASSLIMTIIISSTTLLHHLFPEILRIPSVRGPYTINPFWLDLLYIDSLTIVLSNVLIYHGIKTQGKFKTISFFYGSIIFSGLEENIWILTGRFNILPFKTYFFTRGGLWFFEIPLSVCLVWFIITWSCVYVAEIIFPNKKYAFHAFIAGIFAVSLDLFIDPMMVNLGATSLFSDSEGMWVWLSDPNTSFLIFSIPFFNFLGWFFVIFGFLSLYGYIFDNLKIKSRGNKKSYLSFILGIPVMIITIFIIILLVNYPIQALLGGIDIIPVE
ncbi:MAG: carotenoid biosynthesis protein [Promethearchaeota archaeon]